MMSAIRVHLKVRGRVQGVFFRASACDEARALGLTGWVRNCRDGSVESVAEGEEKRVERFVAWCHSGPPGALVTEVEIERLPAGGDLRGFAVTR